MKKDKSHFIYWCWLNQGEPGPLNHVRDFLRIISDSKFFDKIVVFSNINLNKNLKEIYVCNISTKSYLVFQIISFFRMVKSFSKTEHQVFYFRYCSFLFLPIFLKLMGKREIFLEINGIPNQFLLEGLRRPFTKYFRKLLLQQYDRFLFQRVDHIVTVCSVFRDNLVKNYLGAERYEDDATVFANVKCTVSDKCRTIMGGATIDLIIVKHIALLNAWIAANKATVAVNDQLMTSAGRDYIKKDARKLFFDAVKLAYLRYVYLVTGDEQCKDTPVPRIFR